MWQHISLAKTFWAATTTTTNKNIFPDAINYEKLTFSISLTKMSVHNPDEISEHTSKPNLFELGQMLASLLWVKVFFLFGAILLCEKGSYIANNIWRML